MLFFGPFRYCFRGPFLKNIQFMFIPAPTKLYAEWGFFLVSRQYNSHPIHVKPIVISLLIDTCPVVILLHRLSGEIKRLSTSRSTLGTTWDNSLFLWKRKVCNLSIGGKCGNHLLNGLGRLCGNHRAEAKTLALFDAFFQ